VSKIIIHIDILRKINVLQNNNEKLKLKYDRREQELMNMHENCKTELRTMLQLRIEKNNQHNDCILRVYIHYHRFI
jgi:DNA replication initiation complex subunit (GINS family)